MPSPIRSAHRQQSPSAPDADRHHNRSRHDKSHRHRHRSRSRSPHRSDRHKSEHRHRRHDREHGRDRKQDRDRQDSKRKEAPAQPIVLPLQARELSKRDFEIYEPMFAMYLDIQKGLIIEDLQEDEVKGRWKSFTGKWNRGELAEGWYDPATLEKARQSAAEYQQSGEQNRASPDYGPAEQATGSREPAGEDDDDEEFGPTLPRFVSMRATTSSGPTIPNMQDLELKRESAIEDAIAAREDSRQQYRSELRSHKTEMRHLEDEVAPRAEAGTRERQLEKRREVAAANKAFAETRRGGSPEAAPEEELMGSGENEFASLKKEKERDQRKKNEREIRREEILRARAAEREERIQKYREKEEETIGWLQALAKQRYG
ncbi:hypothetical protein N7462_006485 [Penicillium macrosclerotiorum]|uniref:uncharacterized protein n=1 Tax=Penicillium macrosclerotiorum TaxID=303699 RepID=UPI002547FE14|nr:uncharacterized protein N7462_006485 [Penicillium macrosclerotiorum]KAJ5683320.1 hypothetical protein N7462_006485 [Penicillium macrosclerotiorum]